MGRKDWEYVNLPKLLVKRLDQFLNSPAGKNMGTSSKSELLRRIVNEFLDEQEKFYNNLESIHDFILGMKEHDHFVLTFNEDPELEEILHAFIERGIKRNQINVLFIAKREEESFASVLGKAVDNIDSMFNSEDILILRAEECFTDGSFSMESVFRNLRYAQELVKRKGKSGLNVVGTLPGALIAQGKIEEALNIEKGFHELVQKFETPISVICLYSSLPKEAEEQFMDCHDLIIKRTVTQKESGLL